MPDIGHFHPQIVHFVVALLFVGVIARVVSLLPLGALGKKLGFAGPMAALLIVLGSIAAVAAVKSGDDAHGPVERVPGTREAVIEHEEWGERVRLVFIVVAALELAAIGLHAKPAAKWLKIGSAVIGLGGLFVVFEAAEHGGDLVYSFAGGVGIRSGDDADLNRLLVTGLYHNIAADRRAGHTDDAARLVDELARRAPGEAVVRWLMIESRIVDRHDAAGALLALDSMVIPAQDMRGRLQKGMLTSLALETMGNRDSALKVLQALQRDFPESPRVANAIQRVGAGGQPRP